MAEASKGDKGNGMRIDTKLVRELAKLLDENNLTEIEVEDGDRKIKVQRSAAGSFVAHPAPAAMPAPAAAQPASAPAAVSAAEAPEAIPGTPVKSPMVGTAYLSPEPGSKNFVGVGDTVKAGDTLLIVEAMKVMNPITAPVSGTLQALNVADAQPVEFDQVLAVIA